LLAIPEVHSILTSAFLGGARNTQCLRIKQEIYIELAWMIGCLGLAISFVVANYFLLLQISTPAIASLGIAGEFGLALLVVWLISVFLKRKYSKL
jgi:hypothetical protein